MQQEPGQQVSSGSARAGGRWSQERRLEFIDYRLRWDGRLNRSDLIDFFSISTPQASLDIARYSELAPANIRYDRSGRVYLAGEDFEPVYPVGSAQRFLGDVLAQAAGLSSPGSSFLGWGPPVGVVPVPSRVIPVETLLTILRAIRTGRTLRVVYQSMTSTDPKERELSPHALGHDGFRWHVRAYCHSRKEFRDFLIARMLVVALGDASEVSASSDQPWHTVVRLVLAPNPKLSLPRRRVVELDYGMLDGQAVLECRQALLFYVLKQLGFEDQASKPVEAQQVVLLNADEVRQLLVAASQ
ncbi:transcriptional regulator [Comamonas aquatica]|uniref:helix-turn-helix transcriptional regulator n=1 Tax=Comamonas aquatica TaxID=225991 RepID=UPI0005ED434D|nr:WYL domain-containing protein [Comamonas aquatica]ANY61066.1 transcriptional regulator [Comamonas aquatica]